MREDLHLNWGIVPKPIVLYDKANTKVFRPFNSNEERNKFLHSLNINLRDSVFIVSSTSWTKDEVLFNIYYLKGL
jgi:hypothetical protein